MNQRYYASLNNNTVSLKWGMSLDLITAQIRMLYNARISRKYRISEITRPSADSFPRDQIRGITINQKLLDNKISLIICLSIWQVGSHYTPPPSFFRVNLLPSKKRLEGKMGWRDARQRPFGFVVPLLVGRCRSVFQYIEMWMIVSCYYFALSLSCV